MSKALAHISLIAVLVVAALSSGSAQAPADTSADARLRALYTEEWTWRQKELGRGGPSDRFAPVDAASQQARLAYWTKALATLDTIPFDQLSAEEKINARRTDLMLTREAANIAYWQRKGSIGAYGAGRAAPPR